MKSPGSLVSFAAALFLALGAWVQAKDADGVAASYPDLQFDTTRYDFGVVKQDDPVKHQFNFKNAGRGELVLQSIKTTCGCTAATASTGPYRSGEYGSVDASYNTSGKFGHTQKEIRIYSNDPHSPHVLMMMGTVTESAHPMKSPGDVLFKGSCVDCHATPAKGKSGRDLYDAVCFMCHDSPPLHGKNPIAPSRAAMSRLSESDLKRIISDGINGVSMPGYLKKRGGPLTKDQIRSLVEYIRSQSQSQ